MGRGQGTKARPTAATRRGGADRFAQVLGSTRGHDDTPDGFIRATDVREGTVLDLEGDRYGDHDSAQFEADEVYAVGYERSAVVIHSELHSFACPPDHLLKLNR